MAKPIRVSPAQFARNPASRAMDACAMDTALLATSSSCSCVTRRSVTARTVFAEISRSVTTTFSATSGIELFVRPGAADHGRRESSGAWMGWASVGGTRLNRLIFIAPMLPQAGEDLHVKPKIASSAGGSLANPHLDGAHAFGRAFAGQLQSLATLLSFTAARQFPRIPLATSVWRAAEPPARSETTVKLANAGRWRRPWRPAAVARLSGNRGCERPTPAAAACGRSP